MDLNLQTSFSSDEKLPNIINRASCKIISDLYNPTEQYGCCEFTSSESTVVLIMC